MWARLGPDRLAPPEVDAARLLPDVDARHFRQRREVDDLDGAGL